MCGVARRCAEAKLCNATTTQVCDHGFPGAPQSTSARAAILETLGWALESLESRLRTAESRPLEITDITDFCFRRARERGDGPPALGSALGSALVSAEGLNRVAPPGLGGAAAVGSISDSSSSCIAASCSSSSSSACQRQRGSAEDASSAGWGSAGRGGGRRCVPVGREIYKVARRIYVSALRHITRASSVLD